MTFQNHWLISTQITQIKRQLDARIGWEDQNGLSPVYFVGQTSSDFLKDLLCTCKGKSSCSQDCVCAEQNLTCTELCQCQGTEISKRLFKMN
jgi:hypothetical protein